MGTYLGSQSGAVSRHDRKLRSGAASGTSACRTVGGRAGAGFLCVCPCWIHRKPGLCSRNGSKDLVSLEWSNRTLAVPASETKSLLPLREQRPEIGRAHV